MLERSVWGTRGCRRSFVGSIFAESASMLTDPFGTNQITKAIVGCAIRVHSEIGPGVFEAIYSESLQYELSQEKLSLELNRAAPLVYKGIPLKSKYYLDLVVEGRVAVELKSVTTLLDVHKKQLLSQLRLTNLPVGLLINFNVALLSDGGVKRIINPKYKGSVMTPTVTQEATTVACDAKPNQVISVHSVSSVAPFRKSVSSE